MSEPQSPLPSTSTENAGSAACENKTKSSSEMSPAKLSFSYLEDTQGDSSLEPGEVKTPPRNTHSKGISPIAKSSTISNSNKEQVKAKSFKTVSQLEAEMCKEKVQAILELDAIRKKDDVEKRKLQKQASQPLSPTNISEINMKLLKSNRKKLKRLKNEYNTDRLFNFSERDRQRDSSFGRDDISNAINSPFGSTPNSPSNLPLDYQDSNNFLSFRPMNPFSHGPHSDFQYCRRYAPRRHGSPRMPPFRPQYYNSTVPSRHLGNTACQYPLQPSRGHSPIEPPSDLKWTKTKPSISYSFNPRYKNHHSKIPKVQGNTFKSKHKDKKVTGLDKSKNESTNSSKIGNLSKKQKLPINVPLKAVMAGPEEDHLVEDVPLNPFKTSKIVDIKDDSLLKRKVNTTPKSELEQYSSAAKKKFIDIFEDTPSRPGKTITDTNNQTNKHEESESKNHKHKIRSIVDEDYKASDTIIKRSKVMDEIVTKIDDGSCKKVKQEPAKKLQEIQDRIDKMLQEDDLKIEVIQATKEKLLQKTRSHVKDLKQRSEKVKENEKLRTRKDSTHINPFKRSISQEKCNATGSNAEENKEPGQVSSEDTNSNSSPKNLQVKNHQEKSSMPSSYSESHHRESPNLFKIPNSNNSSPQRIGDTNKVCQKHYEKEEPLSIYPPVSSSKTSEKQISILPDNAITSEENKESGTYNPVTKRNMSLTGSNLSSPQKNCDNISKRDKTEKEALGSYANTYNKDKPDFIGEVSFRNTESSPDTDDYSDNWENDDMECSTYMSGNNLSPSQESNVNDSPPLHYTENIPTSVKQSTTPTTSPPVLKSADKKANKCDFTADTIKIEDTQGTYSKYLNIEDIDDEFDANKDCKLGVQPKSNKKNKSISPASSSSPSTSSSDTSNSSSSSSSTSSSSSSSSEESNDESDIFQESIQNENMAEKSSKKKLGLHQPTMEEINNTSSINTSPKASSSKTPNLCSIGENSSTPSMSVNNSDLVRDLKKLEILESNLTRIQMMRANYDSVDEISEELLKMEKLFSQEKNILLQKCAKPSLYQANIGTQTVVGGSTNETKNEYLSPQHDFQSNANSKPDETATNIFDTNREAIKLKISPIKFTKTSTLLKFGNTIDKTIGTSKHKSEPTDDADFTEKLMKPAKEVAIVKPIMESKDSQVKHSRHRRSETSSRRRSPSFREYFRRSSSRSRSSPRRFDRPRSLSGSPFRHVSKRYVSPPRRPTRRNSARRSRSRTRSPGRIVNRRMSEVSPLQRRRRQYVPPGDKYRKGRWRRESRSPFSPPPPAARHHRHGSHSSLRSSPLSLRHSRERYSRSPLPFKPPSPPMRQSLSPIISRRRSSASPSQPSPYRSNSGSPGRSPRLSKSSHSGYNDRAHRRDEDYDRHSISMEREYYSTKSSNHYSLSPNRMSLDARIDIVLNGQTSSHEGPSNDMTTFDGYTNYAQYGGATYMSMPSDSNSYYTNQYVHMTNSETSLPVNQSHQTVYSNINDPVCNIVPSSEHQMMTASHNYYYNEFNFPSYGVSKPSPFLKELPKATVVLQKGNVLEIIPSNELLPEKSIVTQQRKAEEMELDKEKPKSTSWKEEDNDPENISTSENASRSILKKMNIPDTTTSSKLENLTRKKVYFEDGMCPNNDSEDEDRKAVETQMRIQFRRIRRKFGVVIPYVEIMQTKSPHGGNGTAEPKKASLPPPPPPPGAPPAHLEQPVYLRSTEQSTLIYFHFDAVVNSMYISQSEKPMPPRLFNPKMLPSFTTGSLPHNAAVQSPSNIGSPNNALIPISTNKMDINTIPVQIHANRCENTSPKPIISTALVSQRRESPRVNFKAHSPIHPNEHMLQATSANSVFIKHSLPTMGAASMSPKQRQISPVGWGAMRTHLPPSPLTREAQIPSTNKIYHAIEPVTNVGQSFTIPPPIILPRTIRPHTYPPTADYSTQISAQEQQQYSYPHFQNNVPIPSPGLHNTYRSMSPGNQTPHHQNYMPPQNQVPNYHVPEFPPQLPAVPRHLINPGEFLLDDSQNISKIGNHQTMLIPNLRE